MKTVEPIEIRRFVPCPSKNAGEGICRDVCQFTTEKQLLSPSLWAKTVNQFRLHPDSSNHGWRGEYWGKLMRGSCMICQVTGDELLYQTLTESVNDLLTTQNPDGSFSSYPAGDELFHWDIWCRKYVMLGLEHYLEICRDADLSERVLSALKAHADALIRRVGKGENKIPITQTSHLYEGMNSASILEPMMILYRLTGEKRYLTFSEEILEEGFCRTQNLIRTALEDQTDPYTWGQTKAYEMMSCFEGALEYAEATGNTVYRDAALRFGYRVLKSEVTVIGCCGTLSEFFDHSAQRQTHRPTGIIQETCVTVTWMKLCRRLFAHSGDPVFLDAMEQSFYNAFLGAANTKEQYSHNRHQPHFDTGVPSFLAFDSYSPLIPGERGEQTGGAQILEDGSIFGCCAAIAPAGAAILPLSVLWREREGVLLGFYENGTYPCESPARQPMTVTVKGNYPKGLKLTVVLNIPEPEEFSFSLRIPGWSEETSLLVNGEKQAVNRGILTIHRVWRKGDTVSLALEDSVKWKNAPVYTKDTVQKMDWSVGGMVPVPVEQLPEDRDFIAFFRGPLTLGTDSSFYRACNGEIPTMFLDRKDQLKTIREIPTETLPVPALYALEITDAKGNVFLLSDYSSAGKDWEKSLCCAWIPTKSEL